MARPWLRSKNFICGCEQLNNFYSLSVSTVNAAMRRNFAICVNPTWVLSPESAFTKILNVIIGDKETEVGNPEPVLKL